MTDDNKKQETSDERVERELKLLKEIEKREAINFPKINYKWFELSGQIVIEIYIKDLQEGDISAKIDDNDASILYITVRGEEHKFDLYGTVKDPEITIRKIKAQIAVTSTMVPKSFPVLLKAEGRINEAKQRKYQELDKIGASDKATNSNQMFDDLFQNATADQRKAMIKSMQESGGTVLSTDWADVSKRRVEPQRGG